MSRSSAAACSELIPGRALRVKIRAGAAGTEHAQLRRESVVVISELRPAGKQLLCTFPLSASPICPS